MHSGLHVVLCLNDLIFLDELEPRRGVHIICFSLKDTFDY